MNIKVCGVNSLKQLQQLDGLDIDFAGINFYPADSRFIGDKINAADLKSADLDIKIVGVFVNAEFDEIMKQVEIYNLDLVQLHGDESPFLCEKISGEIEVIKTFRIDDKSTKSVDSLIADYDEVCDYYLFDTLSDKGFGPTITKFDWKKVVNSKIEKPFFLSGGIQVSDSQELKAFKHPDFFGIDVNALFEKEAGVKDMALVLQFKHGLKMKAV